VKLLNNKISAQILMCVVLGLVIYFGILRFTKYPTPYSTSEILFFEMFAGLILLPVISMYLILVRYFLRFHWLMSTVILILLSWVLAGASMVIFEWLMSYLSINVMGRNTVPQVVVGQFVAVVQLVCLIAIALGVYEKFKNRNSESNKQILGADTISRS
jgi:hypothetical protein